MSRVYQSLAIAFLLFISACGAEKADLIVYNGTIYTADNDSSVAQAFAVKDKIIVAVGTSEEIQQWKCNSTEEVNLEGKAVIPGLVEAHAHVMGVGYNNLQLDLLDTKSYEEIAERVKEATSLLPEGEWILGRGWHQDKWDSIPQMMIKDFPINDLLNEVAPNHPVYLKHASGHAALANNKALELAGVSRDTRSPDGGEVVRDLKGNATGFLNETAQYLVNKVIPENTPEKNKQALNLAMDECLSYGITSFHNAGATKDEIALFEDFAKNGDMRIRLYTMLNGRDQELLNTFYKRGPQIGLGDNRLTIRSIKLYGDGALGSRGAWLHEPYTDASSEIGMVVTPLERIKSVVFDGLNNGFQVCTHAIGDKANTVALDFYEEAFATYPDKAKDHRFRIEHAQHLIAEDIPRFAEMGVIPAMQAIHMSSDRPWAIQRLGIERIREGAYVWQSLLKSGAKIVNGTDAPVEPLNPFKSFYSSISRKTLEGLPEEGYEPLQKMTRNQALRSYTIDAAYGAFEENIIGSIEVGKRADFAVLDRDIMTVPEMEVQKVQVLKTYLDGKQVFEKASN
jgi:predicted amidohydrolase YtcJ